ncbi:hypothetical protein [Streptomyces sp. NPDC047097]|uniref:FitA-like ribbon-helix-helix domain-containing protein n=1 Tax=Streptomyces sp. NPDC047097 TaxID=3155260 RepID=UPI0033F5925E
MATIHIRDVPDDILTTLKVRAARAGQSLQAYSLQVLTDDAALLSPAEAAEEARRIAARSSVTSDDISDAIEHMRETRAW